MPKSSTLDALYPECPVRNIISRLGDKWSILVLFTIYEKGTIRFKELQREIPDISQKVLTATLRTLEEDGLLVRTVYAVVPPKVEYSLTQRAQSLIPHLSTLIGWAKENMSSIISDRQKKIA